jgi:APA family basic amino acid/polyamine antiporter
VKRPFRIPLNIKNIPVLSVFGLVTCLLLLTQLNFDAITLGIGLTVVGIVLAFLSRE